MKNRSIKIELVVFNIHSRPCILYSKTMRKNTFRIYKSHQNLLLHSVTTAIQGCFHLYRKLLCNKSYRLCRPTGSTVPISITGFITMCAFNVTNSSAILGFVATPCTRHDQINDCERIISDTSRVIIYQFINPRNPVLRKGGVFHRRVYVYSLP